MLRISEVEKMPDLLTYNDLKEIFGVSMNAIYKRIRDGRFPKPLDIFGSKFRRDDIIAVMRGEWKPAK